MLVEDNNYIHLRTSDKEMENYKLDIFGVSEMRWTGQGRMDNRSRKYSLYSGNEQHHTHEVGILFSKSAAQTL